MNMNFGSHFVTFAYFEWKAQKINWSTCLILACLWKQERRHKHVSQVKFWIDRHGQTDTVLCQLEFNVVSAITRVLTDRYPICRLSFWTLMFVIIACLSSLSYSPSLLQLRTVMREFADLLWWAMTFWKTLHGSFCIVRHISQLVLSIMKWRWHRFQRDDITLCGKSHHDAS